MNLDDLQLQLLFTSRNLHSGSDYCLSSTPPLRYCVLCFAVVRCGVVTLVLLILKEAKPQTIWYEELSM